MFLNLSDEIFGGDLQSSHPPEPPELERLKAPLTISASDATDLRDVLWLISLGADVRLCKWRQWLIGELENAELADSLNELIMQLDRYSMQLMQASAKLKGRA